MQNDMKKMIACILFLLAGLSAVHAGIQDGSRWYVGNLDYTAKVNVDKTITFTSMAEGEELMFRLTPNYSKPGEYTLSDEPGGDGYNPYGRAPRVKFIDEDGMKLLCLYDQQDQLQDVLDGMARQEGETEAVDKWDIQLAGRYVDKYGDTLLLDRSMIYEIPRGGNGMSEREGAAQATYEHIPFNGTVTGIIRISGSTHLDGTWEAVITLDGLTLYRVAEDTYGIYQRKGGKETLRWAREDFPRFNYTWAILLNDGQFRRLKKSTLRIMRNEILARQGYRFQSKDLQDYFSKFTWYQPLEPDEYGQPNKIEMLNIQLIKAEEAMSDEDRFVKEE